MGVNVGQVLSQGAGRWGERPALIDSETGRPWSYAELDAGARRVAAQLGRRGVQPGQRVALAAGNSAGFVQGWFGIVYAGAAVVPVPILSAAPELAYRLDDAECPLVLTDEGCRELAEQGASLASRRVDRALLSELRSDAPSVSEIAETEANAPAMVLYTSGTTGKPRGALISHASLMLHTAVLVHHTLGLSDADRVLGVLPLTHSYGLRMTLLAPFFAGARTVLLRRFDARQSLQSMHDHRVTWLPGVPTMFAAWAECELPAPRSLRWAMSAGAPLADDIALRAEQRLGVSVRQGYGMTEATFSTIDAPPDARVLGSVGRPVWGIEIRIVDADGTELPAGEAGEILVRGHNTMLGYLGDSEASRRTVRGGWLRTGDVGRVDDEGRLTVVDRIKDLIIRGGNNVYPSEVEDALAAHPDVAEVAVVGRPDAYYGEEVVAAIVRRPDSPLVGDELIAWARQRLARTKVPRQVVFLDSLPIGASGKVVKRTLRQWLVEGRIG